MIVDVDDRGRCMRLEPSLSAHRQRLHQPSRFQGGTNRTLFAEMEMPILPLSPG